MQRQTRQIKKEEAAEESVQRYLFLIFIYVIY